MRSVVMSVLIVMSLLVAGMASAATARVATWNLMRLGNGDQKSYPAVAVIAANVDILSIQEVMNDQGLDDLRAALEKNTGEKWSVLASSPVGSKAYKEMYSFVYRNSAITYVDGAVSYLDRKRIFMREPFSARFRSRIDGGEFVLAGVHILYGKSAEDRKPELAELANYWTWLKEVYPGTQIILTGDFNMPPTDPAFSALRQHAMPLVTDGASTLSGVDGRFANLYDNVWMDPKDHPKVTKIGIVNYPVMLGWDHEKSRKVVSDHSPIFMTLGTAVLDSSVVMNAPSKREVTRAVAQRPAGNMPVFAPMDQRLASAQVSGSRGSVRGNRNSRAYHRSEGCPSYNAISPKNRVEFASEGDAKAQGYHLAGNCN